jgi:phosphoglycerate kinase
MIHFLGTIDRKKLHGKTVLLRLDFNTEDDWRMRAVLPTIAFLLRQDCKIVILSHRGRPKPVRSVAAARDLHILLGSNRELRKFSLRNDAARLAKLLDRTVRFVDNFDFRATHDLVVRAPAGSIFLLENLRFLAGEERNDPRLAARLAALGDFYVNDAFAVSHRENASVVAITAYLPSYAGLELEAELHHLSRIVSRPRRPLVMVVGGAKIADKLGVLRFLRRKADWFLLGGGPANTVLAARGMDVRRSLRDTKSDPSIIAKIASYRNLVLPEDYARKNGAIVDIGPRSVKDFSRKIAAAKTIVWSGPLGLIDEPPYDRGSRGVARSVARNRRAFSIAGGGETVMFLKRIRADRHFSFLSTGGGALLDFLAGEKLPGLVALGYSSRSRKAK